MMSLMKGEQYVFHAMSERNELAQMQLLNKALNANPWDSQIRITAVSIKGFSEKQKIAILKEGLKHEPHHAKMLFQYAELLRKSRQVKESLAFYQQAITNDHFDFNKYERYMAVMYEEGQKSFKSNKLDEVRIYRNEVIITYQKAKKLENHLDNNINQRNFIVTSNMTNLYKKTKAHQFN